MPVAVSLILIVLLALAAVGLYFARMIVFPNVSTIAESYQRQVEEGKLDETAFAALSKRELQIKSPFGYNLHAIYFPNGDTHKTVIIAHGISDTLYGSVKYMDLYLKRGFNVLLYDHRNHGQSGKCSTTYGLYEKQDLKAIVDWIFENTGQETLLGTMGESLGAAVVLQHCAVDERVSFVIADCPFADMPELLKYHLKLRYHLAPFPLFYIADFICYLYTGMTFGKVSPIRDIADVRTPVFWIHGQDDTMILPQASINMYEAKKKGIKKIYLPDNTGHAQAYWNNRAEYDRQVGEFLEQVGIHSKVIEESLSTTR